MLHDLRVLALTLYSKDSAALLFPPDGMPHRYAAELLVPFTACMVWHGMACASSTLDNRTELPPGSENQLLLISLLKIRGSEIAGFLGMSHMRIETCPEQVCWN